MKHTKDMTVGSPLRALIFFSLPIILGNLFQQFYNLMDISIVGNHLGEDALAAVGATSALYGLFLSLAHGSANGFSLVIARYFGAKDEKNLRVSIAQTLKLSLMVSGILTVLAFVAVRPLLVLLRTPDVELSYRYISVVLSCVLFTVTYNTLSGILRAVGNSMAPLVFLIIGAFLNIGMDYLFICNFGLGVFGAGLATVLSQALSCVFSGIYLMKKCRDIMPKKEDFKSNPAMVKDLMGNGLSMAMMFSIVSIGSITLQYAVNSLGPVTVAAHTTARKIDETMMVVFSPLSTAAATYCSQNLGAGQIDRIKKGIVTAFAVGFSISLVMIAVALTYGEKLVWLISGSDNAEIIALGSRYLRLNVPFFFFLVTLVVLRSTLQSIGYKVLPLVASGVEMIGKVLIALVLVPRTGYMGITLSEPMIWITCSVIVGLNFIYAMVRLNSKSEKKFIAQKNPRRLRDFKTGRHHTA